MTLDWDGFATGTTIFTTIYLTEAWDTDRSLAQANPDGVGDDIRQLLSVTDLFRPGLDDPRSQLAAWRQSLLDLFGQLDLLALPAMLVFPPRLADLTPDSLLDVIIEITQYIALFNAAGTPCTAQPIRAAGTPIPASLQLVGPRGARNARSAHCCWPFPGDGLDWGHSRLVNLRWSASRAICSSSSSLGLPGTWPPPAMLRSSSPNMALSPPGWSLLRPPGMSWLRPRRMNCTTR